MLAVAGSNLIYHFQTCTNNIQHVATHRNTLQHGGMSLLTMLRYVTLACCDRLAGARLVDKLGDVQVPQCFKPRPNDRNISTQHNLSIVGPALESSAQTIVIFERHLLRNIEY